MKSFFAGIKDYYRAHRAMFKYRLWPIMALPGIMSILYVSLMIYLAWNYADDLTGYIHQRWIPEMLRGAVIYSLTAVLVWLMLLLTAYVTYQPVILILFSPVLSYVSEQVEVRMYGGKSPGFSFKQLVRDILRALVINGKNLVKMTIFIALAWLLVLLPFVGALMSSAIILMIESYYNGYALVDFTLERKRFNIRESARFGRRNRWRLAGIGAGFILMMFIPVAGWFAAPSYGTVAATIAALEVLRSERSGPAIP